MLQYIVSGLAAGSVYALIALGLVLIYKTTQVVNFAQGEVAMVATFVALTLLTQMDIAYGPTIVATLLFAGVLGMVIERTVMRPAVGLPPFNILIITLGIWIILNNAAGWIWTRQSFGFPSLFPQDPIRVGGINIAPTHLGTIAVSLAILGIIFAFLHLTKEGTAMRATAENRVAAKLVGINVGRVYAVSWFAGSVVAAVGGILLAPIIFVDVSMMFPILIKAFAGAILGGFESLPGAIVGCLMLGVLENVMGALVSTTFQNLLAFLLIMVILLVRPTGLFGASRRKRV